MGPDPASATGGGRTQQQTGAFADAAEIYARAQIGGALVLGSHPVVLVVDLQRGFTDEDGPLGADLAACVTATRRLLEVARSHDVPVTFTVIAYASADAPGVWTQKLPALAELRAGSRWSELDPRLDRRPSEPIIEKSGASALHRTCVASLLRRLGADTVVLCGTSTSGCVRATAVDLMQEGYPVLVPAECCGDRAQAPHDANLFDMSAKYADVVTVTEAIEYLASRTPEPRRRSSDVDGQDSLA